MEENKIPQVPEENEAATELTEIPNNCAEENSENITENYETNQEIIAVIDKTEKKSVGKEIFEWVQAIVVAFVVAMFLRTFVFTMVVVDGTSMEPTLHHAERMVVSRMNNNSLKYGDVVIFRPEMSPETPYVKRVIATAGQTVSFDFESGITIVDGEPLYEPYIYDTINSDKFGTFNPYTNPEITVPDGCLFVMGDNRNNSRDSRMIGVIETEDVIGKAIFRFWPLNRAGVDFKIK